MRSRLAISLLLGATAALSACGGSSGDSAERADAESAAVTVPTDVAITAPSGSDGVGSLGDAVEVMAGAPGQANEAVCDIERKTLATAEEAFVILNARMPTSEAELVEQQLILEPTAGYEITGDGQIVPAPGSPCL